MEKKKNFKTPNGSAGSDDEDEIIFSDRYDGMSTGTAKLAINKKLRKLLLENYDLIELINKGRYYAAKACSKDNLWLYELLIDKQSGSIQIVSKKRKTSEQLSWTINSNAVGLTYKRHLCADKVGFYLISLTESAHLNPTSAKASHGYR